MKAKITRKTIEGVRQNYAVFNPSFLKRLDLTPGELVRAPPHLQGFYVMAADTIEDDTVGIHPKYFDKNDWTEGSIVQFEKFSVENIVGLIRNKVSGRTWNAQEIHSIIHAIDNEWLTPSHMATFATSCEINHLTDSETVFVASSFFEFSAKLHLRRGPVVDKHSIGGIPGNRITPIMVPIIAAAGLTIPKVSTRAITSPAGTIDSVELIMNVDFSPSEAAEIVEKTGGCIVNGETVGLGQTADKLIKVLKEVRLDPKELMIASILAKKSAAGSKYVLIDLPTGRGAKLPSKQEARSLAHLFSRVGHELGLHVESVISPGDKPIGEMIGPALEMKEAMMILEGKPSSLSLRRKAVSLSGIIFEMVGLADRGEGAIMAENILASGKALLKLREIIEAQGGDPHISSEDIPTAEYKEKIFAKKDDVVYTIDSKALRLIAHTAGAPQDKEAGVVLLVDRGEEIQKGEALFEIHANSASKLEQAISLAREKPPLVLEKMVLEHIKDVVP